MIEAFERHLRQHNISKQFEEAKTKEDKIEVCKKFLESEGYEVQYPSIKAQGIVGGSSGSILDSIFVDSTVSSGKILGTWEPSTVNNPVTYINAGLTLSEHEANKGSHSVVPYVTDKLTSELAIKLRQYVIDKNIIKRETDHATLNEHFRVRIGIVG